MAGTRLHKCWACAHKCRKCKKYGFFFYINSTGKATCPLCHWGYGLTT